MKTKLLITSLIMGLTGVAHADIDTSDMPFQYPDRCAEKKSIVMPAGQEGTSYYFNRDCSVAYIVPPPTGSVTVSNPAVLTNMMYCPALSGTAKSVVSLQKQINSLLVESAKSSTSDDKRLKLNESIASLRKLSEDMSHDFVSLPGMTVQMSFKSSLTPEFMNAIQIANLPLIEAQKIKIRPAPLQKSYLSFNAVIPGSNTTYAGNPVLDSNIMGILSNADEKQSERQSVNFQGSAEGYVTLSLSGACSVMSGDYSKPSELKINPEMASAYLTVTNTMMVPLISSFGYKAEFDVKNATTTLFNKYATNSVFTSRDLTKLLLEGESKDAFKVTAWTYETLQGTMETQQAEQMTAENINLIKSAMVAEYADKLVQYKALSVITPLSAPAAGNATETGTRRECYTSSSWFGLSSDTSCRDVTFQFSVPHDGQLQQNVELINQLSLSFNQTVEIFHPINRIHTSIFKVSGGVK